MNKMKKALLLVLSLAMSATLFAACGKDKGNGGNTSSSSAAGSEVSTPVESESSEESSSEAESESSSETPVESESESESSSETPVESESESESSSEEPVVDETAPVFGTIDKTVFEGLKVGDKITVPTVTATDETDGEVTVYVSFGNMMMQMPTQMGEEITLEFAGTYILKYTAQDAAENVAEETIEIVVVCDHAETNIQWDENEHWEVCGSCEAEVEDSRDDHEMVIVDTDAEVDTLACECGYVDENYSFNKVVTATNTFNINDETIALDLTGISEYSSVALIMLGEYTLGTDINALEIPDELKDDKASHGQQEITVFVVDADGYEHLISVPVTIITKNIATVNDFKELQIKASTESIYGYYVLTQDILSTSAVVAPAGFGYGTGEEWDGTQGFHGTIIGNNHVIEMPAGARGMFGTIGNGATFKDITFNCTSINLGGWGTTFFARLAVGATFENVTINVSGITSGAKGLLFELGTMDCDFIDVNININGGAVQHLFGLAEADLEKDNIGFNANQAVRPDTLCTFTNTKITLANDATLNILGSANDIANGKVITYIAEGCTTTEGTVVEGISIVIPKKPVTLAAQDVYVTDATHSLNLGDYAGYTVKSISFNGTKLDTTDVSAVTIPDAVKSDAEQHGTGKSFIVTLDDPAGEFTVEIPVTIITKTIATVDDFKALQIAKDGDIVYGYYVLTADLTSVPSVGPRPQPTDAGLTGFRGTLDGRGATITAAAGNGGILGNLGTGAVIKNTTFTCNSIKQNAWESLLACYGIGATIEDCEFNFSGITGADAGKKGLILEMGGRGCAFNNVVINITGNASTLFGGHGSNWVGFNANQQNYWGTKCTFSNTTVNLMTADSSLAMIGEGYLATGAYQSGTVKQFIVDGCTTAAGETTETVAGITIVKAAE